ncbi:MAG TPA: DEAD/DEAH box helicase, partial [Pirellulales bacterium]|nr:DEAD/DEAH box helicase [Pirellulales bacterium]
EYDPQWLDNLFLSGEVMWGRLNAPRRDEEAKPSTAALSRVVPISLMLREELPALLGEGRPIAANVRSGAQAVLDALESRGALFFGELKTHTNLLSAQVEEALRELAALGRVTSDVFAAVRTIVEGHVSRTSRRRARRPMHSVAVPIGRWSLFPGAFVPPSREAYLEAWCRQLLRRWGIVFRDLLVRETSAPSWQEMVGTLRRMELRGEVRGGRFVSGVAGEQYALAEAVERLRQTRDEAAEGSNGETWIVISAADPVNLFGVVTEGPRVAATHRNALILQSGRLVASRQAGNVEFYEPLAPAIQWEMRRALATGNRAPQPSAEPEMATRHRQKTF